jgi:beta-lactam-binding protein with PASTA domain
MLLVNRGESTQRFVMPDLIGTFGERVAGLMRAADFRVSLVGDSPYPGLPAGIVVHQTPQAGFQIGLKEAISLEISR